MYLISTINKKILNAHKKEALKLCSKILGNFFFDFDEKFFDFLMNSKIRSKMFDLLNMNISIQNLNYVISKRLEKKFKEKLINWTYPQIRIDGKFAKKFSAPIHKDKWILDKNKKGIYSLVSIKQKWGIIISEQKKKNE